VNTELGMMMEQRSWNNYRYSLDSRLEGLRKITKNFNKDSWCPSRDSNRLPPEYSWKRLPR
jgi:hypothetical protein